MVDRTRIAAALAAGLCLLAGLGRGVESARAQSVEVDSLIRAGDEAARDSEHHRALRLYGQAVARDSSLAEALAAKIGRQHLWAGETEAAIRWLRRYRDNHPRQCDVWLDYALALSWAGRLGNATTSYQAVLEACPSHRNEARLGLARVRRWQEQLGKARRLYEDVRAAGAPDQQEAARVGLGLLSRSLFEPRRALTTFQRVLAEDSSAVAAVEGLAAAYMDLGLDDRAEEVLTSAAKRGLHSPGMEDARERLEARQSVSLETAGSRFSDSDGTDLTAGRLLLSVPVAFRTNVVVSGERLELTRSGAFSVWSPGVRLTHQFSAAWQLSTGGYWHQFEGGTRDLTTGWGTLAWTPSDRFRLEASGGRTWLPDNFAALRERVTGAYGSVQTAVGIGPYDVLELTGHLTRFGDERHRLRGTLQWSHRFEGVPRLTIRWPTTVLTYDNPFPFALWSPDFYVESGPGLSLYQRLGTNWHLNLFARGGVQRETGLDAQFLADLRGGLSWEYAPGSRLWIDASWSNSSVAGAQGFRRTAAEAGLAIAF